MDEFYRTDNEILEDNSNLLEAIASNTKGIGERIGCLFWILLLILMNLFIVTVVVAWYYIDKIIYLME